MGTIQQPKAKEEVQKDNLDSMLLLKITGMALLVAAAMATGTCPFTNGMGGGCANRMTKPNGSCKTGMVATCVLCSGCDYYKVDQANEQATTSYLLDNPHCARCRKLGKPTAIRRKSDFSGGLWNCLQKPAVPAKCFDFAKCNRINDPNERGTCKNFYGKRWGLVAVTCPPQIHHLIYVLHCLQIGPAICQA